MTEKKPISPPPLILTYDQRKKIVENFKTSKIYELKQKGFKTFKLSKSLFDYLLLKGSERIFLILNHSLLPKSFNVEKLKNFSRKYHARIWIISDKGVEEISDKESLENFQEHGRSYITLKCYKCGHKTRFYFHTELICPECGYVYKYRCIECGREFYAKEAEYCGACSWFICPYCGACGCLVKEAIKFYKQMKNKHLASYRKHRRKMEVLTEHGLMVVYL